MCHQRSQQMIWETISAFLSGQQFNQWKASGATITWVVLWLSSHSFPCNNYTHTGWAHTGTARGSLSVRAGFNVPFKDWQWPHKNISQRPATEPPWKGFLGSPKCILVLGVKATSLVNIARCEGYFTGKLKHLLQNLKFWGILEKSTQEFIGSKYISPVCFWKH